MGELKDRLDTHTDERDRGSWDDSKSSGWGNCMDEPPFIKVGHVRLGVKDWVQFWDRCKRRKIVKEVPNPVWLLTDLSRRWLSHLCFAFYFHLCRKNYCKFAMTLYIDI